MKEITVKIEGKVSNIVTCKDGEVEVTIQKIQDWLSLENPDTEWLKANVEFIVR